MRKVSGRTRAKSRDDIRLEEFLPYRFYLITASLSGLLLEKLRPHGVTVQRWRVLMVVANHGPKSIGQLVDLTFIPQSGLSRVIDQMERDDLVSRSTAEHDSRVVQVHLTDNGRAIYQKLVPVVRDYADALTAGFDPAEQQTLVDYLGRVLGNLKAHATPEAGSASGADNTTEADGDAEPPRSSRAKRSGAHRSTKVARR